ncbi:g896 [Coccomyxa elongata]
MRKPKKPPKHPDIRLQEQCLIYSKNKLFKEKVVKEKAVRKDVKERALTNANSTFTVVKTTWRALGRRAVRLLDLETALREVNKTIAEAYLLANVHVVRLCTAGIPLSELDQTFFHRCLSAVSVSKKRKPETKDFELLVSARLYRSWRPEGYVPPVSTHLACGFHQQASQQMATNMRNSTVANFYRRFKRYLKVRYALDGKQAYEALQSIRAVEYEGEDPLVKRYRDLLPPKPEKGRLEDSPELVMPLQHLFLRTFEAAQSDRQTDRPPRLFSLVPTKQGFECSHIKICANGLYSLLKRNGIKHLPKDADTFRPVADAYWRRFFHISKFETINRRFAGEILTDGKGVSIVLRRPKAEASTPGATLDPNAFGEVWGLDPGRREMFVASNDAEKVQRVTTRQFYHDAKYRESNAKIKGWQDRDPEILGAFRNMPSKKHSHLEGLQAYVGYLLPMLDTLMRWHMRKGFRDLKFKRYVFAKKVLRTICQDLTREAGQNTLVGFGDWSNQDSAGIIKKSPAGPVKRLENELRRHCRVVSVDEHLTSKLHSCCHHRMKQMYQQRMCRDGVMRSVKVHSVLHCDNNGCHGMTVNRDVNASRNILHILRATAGGGPRPEAFHRSRTKYSEAPAAGGLPLDGQSTLALLPVPCVSDGPSD